MNSHATRQARRWAWLTCASGQVVQELESRAQAIVEEARKEQVKLAAEAARKIQRRDDEFARLEAALAEAAALAADYAATYEERRDIIKPEEHEIFVQTVLAREPGSPRSAEHSLLKFNSQPNKLVCGEFADAANGTIELLKVDERELQDKLAGGLPAMEAEIRAHGNALVTEMFEYVCNEACEEKEYPNGIRDEGRAGMRLAGSCGARGEGLGVRARVGG